MRLTIVHPSLSLHHVRNIGSLHAQSLRSRYHALHNTEFVCQYNTHSLAFNFFFIRTYEIESILFIHILSEIIRNVRKYRPINNHLFFSCKLRISMKAVMDFSYPYFVKIGLNNTVAKTYHCTQYSIHSNR